MLRNDKIKVQVYFGDKDASTIVEFRKYAANGLLKFAKNSEDEDYVELNVYKTEFVGFCILIKDMRSEIL